VGLPWDLRLPPVASTLLTAAPITWAGLRKDRTLNSFTTHASAALSGPDWLRRRRASAAESFTAASLPTAEEEVWRYSRIDDLDLDAYAPVAGPVAGAGADAPGAGTGSADGLRPLLAATAGRAALAVAHNGRIGQLEVRADLAAQGVRVGPVGEGDADVLGLAIDQAPDVFLGFNDAFVADAVVVRVPAGVSVGGPVVVVHVTEGDRVAAFPRLVVDAGADSDVSVLEVQLSGGRPALVVPVTEIVAGRAARVGHVTVQQLGLATWQLALQVASVEAEASLRTTSVGFGGDYARLRTDCRMVGRGATGELDAVYFGEGDQTLDFRTFQDHVAPDCTSNLLFKGAVGGRSRSVYTGMIRVGKAARGTNAFQTNRNVKLSDGAWAESVPNLVIENNDVRCSHASAVGPIDEEQRFYLESRGVPTDEAERLIVSGFFDEVLGRLPVPSVAPPLRATVATKFERRGD
jgi:Fe-S cluster assembly protein SufD